MGIIRTLGEQIRTLLAVAILLTTVGISTSPAQARIGLGTNLFLESATASEGGDIAYEDVTSFSLRYAQKNMFAEIRFLKYDFTDNPRAKDPDSLAYNAQLDEYYMVRPYYEPVANPNRFELTYVSFIIGPRFELLKHIAYELGSSIDVFLYSNNTYGDFENNPYLVRPMLRTVPEYPDVNISFYSRIQAWYDVTSRWRLSATWEFNTAIDPVLLEDAGFYSNSGKTVNIEEIRFNQKFYLNFLLEYRIDWSM
jgi:hypothetical protein